VRPNDGVKAGRPALGRRLRAKEIGPAGEAETGRRGDCAVLVGVLHGAAERNV